ncbi:MAG TPA: hypothetical protein VGO67_20995 [Verrucomicrobiae bacterium]
MRLAEGTDSLCLLKALASGKVYYDPGIKLERASTDSPKPKPRSQFRIASKTLVPSTSPFKQCRFDFFPTK